MRRFRTSLLGAAVGLAVLAGTAQVSNASPNTAAPTPAQYFQAAANTGVQLGYPGVMAAIVDGSSRTYVTAGSNVRGSSTPLDPAAKFRIGSNTKTFTAAVVLQLEAEGKLSLSDTVAKWLPNAVKANGYDGNTITIRELLNQNSGLPDYMPAYNFDYYLMRNVNAHYTPQQLVSTALTQRSPKPLPRTFEYANTNYVLAGMIIQAVTGNSPSVEVTNRIITPLNLTGTSYPESSVDIYGNFLRGWMWPAVWFGYQPPIADATRSNVELFGPAGAMISTLQDQGTFERALLQEQVLPPAQLAEWKTSVPIGTDTHNQYGLGVTHWQLQCPDGPGPFVWSHGGDVIGYHSRWFASEDGTKQVFYAANEHHGLNLDESAGKQKLMEGAQNAMCGLLKP